MKDPKKHAAMMLALAQDDFRALKAFKDLPQVTTAIFGFHAEQAMEKALKAWLTEAGALYPKVHDIRLLLKLLTDAGQTVPEAFRQLVYLTAFAAQFRYEMTEELVPDLDRAAVIRDVAQVVEHVERLVGAAGSSS
jgi:HEPN domain-containing protein